MRVICGSSSPTNSPSCMATSPTPVVIRIAIRARPGGASDARELQLEPSPCDLKMLPPCDPQRIAIICPMVTQQRFQGVCRLRMKPRCRPNNTGPHKEGHNLPDEVTA